MAPSPITEDYYVVLEIDQTATPELITKSYRRLALKLHPDRSAKGGSTQAFQLLVQAYETLKDVGKRREYDLIYPSISSRATPKSTQTPRPPTASGSQSEACNEVAQLAALRKQKEERGARWRDRRNVFEASIFELKRKVRQLEQEIKNLTSIAAAEAAVEARKNSWSTWILSPLYKQVRESEDEKARKDRERQERKIEKDMKERRLAPQQAQLKEKEGQMAQAKKDFDAAELSSDQAIRAIETRRQNREARERQEKERIERERLAKIQKQQQEQYARQRQERERVERERLAKRMKEQQEQREKEAERSRAAFEKYQAEARAAEQARQEAYRRSQQRTRDNLYFSSTSSSTRQPYTSNSSCEHHGWWEKVHGRAPCPRCDDVWNYLLQCPGCSTEACPKCQSELRPRHHRHTGRTSRREVPRARSPSPYDYGYRGYWGDSP